jgi:hypothetical protein
LLLYCRLLKFLAFIVFVPEFNPQCTVHLLSADFVVLRNSFSILVLVGKR